MTLRKTEWVFLLAVAAAGFVVGTLPLSPALPLFADEAEGPGVRIEADARTPGLRPVFWRPAGSTAEPPALRASGTAWDPYRNAS